MQWLHVGISQSFRPPIRSKNKYAIKRKRNKKTITSSKIVESSSIYEDNIIFNTLSLENKQPKKIFALGMMSYTMGKGPRVIKRMNLVLFRENTHQIVAFP